jgi:putative ABC transport system substrate-binding protein
MISHCKISALWLSVGLILLQLILSVPLLADARPSGVAVVSSGQAPPYRQAAEGFKSRLEQIEPGIEVNIYLTSGKPQELAEVMRQLNTNEPALVLALGTKALRNVGKERPDGPILGALVIDDQNLSSLTNASGMLLDTSAEEQFALLKRVLPKARRVGVLYHPEFNQQRVDLAIRAAKKAGLKIDAVAIASPTELPIALKGLARRVDVIWGIPDAMVMSTKTARNIVLESLRHRVPLVGPSSAWTKAGALYAIEWDYEDIGAQAADMAVDVLKGASIQEIPIARPRRVGYSLNMRTAKQCKLKIDNELIGAARQVIN